MRILKRLFRKKVKHLSDIELARLRVRLYVILDNVKQFNNVFDEIMVGRVMVNQVLATLGVMDDIEHLAKAIQDVYDGYEMCDKHHGRCIITPWANRKFDSTIRHLQSVHTIDEAVRLSKMKV